MTQAPATPSLVERLRSPIVRNMTPDAFLSTVEFDTNGGCWLWPRNHGRLGYTRIGGYSTHRLSFELFVGPIPRGLVIDHKCRVSSCVNPAHLRAVTQAVNAVENSSSVSALNLLVTHCPAGHEYSVENTSRRKRGSSVMRICRACDRIRAEKKRRLRQALSSQGRHEGVTSGSIPESPGVNAVPLPASPDGPSQIDRVWAAINVLGAPDTACTTDEDRAYCRAIGDALSEIEKLGGRPQ